MRRSEDDLFDPEIAETLEAIEATLAGEPVDPRFADVAELSLLLKADRPRAGAEFARSLDERAAARFAAREPGSPRGMRAWLRSWSFGAFGAAGAAALAGLIAVVVVVSGGSGGGGRPAALTVRAPATPAAAGRNELLREATPSSSTTSAGTPHLNSLQAAANGRKVIQSATLDLGAPPARVDDVAQEVYNVIGSVNGVVDHSSVTSTGGSDGSAEFALRVPSASLTQTMSALSRLRYANVLSRTDNTQDVNSRFVDAGRQLADAQALRATLLKQLAAATSQQSTDALKAQLAAAEARIVAAEATLRNLNRQVNFSSITVTIQAGAAGGVGPSSGGFTLHRAAHDALRVLTVALGVVLIALAVLVPVGLLTALAFWTAAAIRRRRREQALDLA